MGCEVGSGDGVGSVVLEVLSCDGEERGAAAVEACRRRVRRQVEQTDCGEWDGLMKEASLCAPRDVDVIVTGE